MKMLFTILIGVVIVTFSWGWVMNVHYGQMTTDKYIHHYLSQIELTVKESIQKTQDFISYAANVQISRPLLNKVTD